MKYLVFTVIASFILLSFSFDAPQADIQYEEVANDSLIAIWDAHIADIMEDMGDKKDLPADSVFENLTLDVLKNMPAGRMLNVMKFGFSRSLGVGCDHCHNTKDWASDDLEVKQTTRDMWKMVGRINQELLQDVSGLTGKQVFVNCTTCHRGQVKPATNLDQ